MCSPARPTGWRNSSVRYLDRVIAEEEYQFLAGHIHDAKLALIEQCGHVTPLEQPHAFTALIRL